MKIEVLLTNKILTLLNTQAQPKLLSLQFEFKIRSW